jgi:hypothetical protein
VNDSDRRRSPDGFDDEAIFADIVAHLKDDETEPEAERAAWSVTWEGPTSHGGNPGTPDPPGDGSDRRTDESAQESADERTGVPPGDSPVVPAPQGWRTHEVEEEEEHFEPPPVSPLPVGDLQFWAILAGMVGGPLLLVYLVFFNRNLSHYLTLVSIAMSVGGFVLLVSRLPGQEGDDDDGARL